MKTKNLRPWQPGVSGNTTGRPKGSRNIKKVIQGLLNDQSMAARLALRLPRDTETPLEAIVHTLVVKAIRGDTRASEVLLKYSVDKDAIPPEGGFFSQSELRIVVVDAEGNQQPSPELVVDGATGTFIS